MTTQSHNVGRYGGVELLTLAPRAATTHRAVESGTWNDTSTWEDGDVPDDGAAVLIDDDVTVTLTHRERSRLETVRVDGTLRFGTATDTKLRADTVLVSKAGQLEIGTVQDPVDPGVTAELEFLAERPIRRATDPKVVGRGLLAVGECEIHGAAKTTWDELDDHARQGDERVTLSGAGPAALDAHGWQAGDEIVFPDQEPWGGVPERVADDGVTPTATHDDEVRTITAVDGDTVSFDSPLAEDHVPPESGLPSYVLNLTRNVQLYSEAENADEFGHAMFMRPEQSLQYFETRRVGRTDKRRQVSNPLWGRGESTEPRHSNPRARYAIHFHRTGPTEPPHTVRGCAIRDNPGWGVVNHDSAADVIENVSYDVDGCAFVTEKGTESGSFRRNFALRSVGSGEEVDSRKGWTNDFQSEFASPPGNVDDFAHHGGGFWMHTPILETEDNVAAGHRAHGFFWHQRSLYEAPLNMQNADGGGFDGDDDELLDGKHDTVAQLDGELLTDREQSLFRRGDSAPPVGPHWNPDASKYYTDSGPIRTFADNTAFGCGAGVEYRSVSYRNELSRFDWSEVEGFTCYNIGDHFEDDGTPRGQFEGFASDGNVGIDHRYVGNLTNVGFTLLGNGSGVGSSRNFGYTNGWDVVDSEIRNWEYGFVPKGYNDSGYNQVTNTVFDNETDVLIKSRFPRGGSGLYLEGNTYRGTNALEWEEAGGLDIKPQQNQLVTHVAPVAWERRNLYHGWCDPNFVLVEEGDDERVRQLLNERDAWREKLDGDDPEQVLPGATHRELYESYGILFYGGMKDPDDADAERPSDFVGSGGPYDSTPFLGPEQKTQPCDEIWIDATDMSLSGSYTVLDYEASDPSAFENFEVLQMATDGRAVQLERSHERNEALPVESDEGVASYTFEIDRPGTYQVYTRAQQGKDMDHIPSNSSHDGRFFVRVDGGEWKLHDGKGPGIAGQSSFSWGRDTHRPFRTFDLDSTGEHTVEIAGKGGDMRLDRVLICHETVAAAPMGPGKEPTP